jgi:hypothetical protein
MFSRLLSAPLVLLLAGPVFAAEVKPIPPPKIPTSDTDRATLTAERIKGQVNDWVPFDAPTGDRPHIKDVIFIIAKPLPLSASMRPEEKESL